MRGRKGSAVLSAALSAALAVSLCPALALADEPAAEGAQQPAAEQPAAEPVEEGEAAAAAEPAVAAEPQAQSAEPAAVPAATLAASYDWYDNAVGSEYAIATAADLLGFANIANGTREGATSTDTCNFEGEKITLANDIDLGGMTWTPIKSFKGEFNGNGKTISNFVVNAESVSGGFFNKIEGSNGLDDVRVHDLTIANVTATVGNVRFGTLANSIEGVIKNVTVKNVKATTTHEDAWVCGMCAFMSWPAMEDCAVENFEVNAQSGAEFVCGFAAILQKNGNYTFKNLNVSGFKAAVSDTDGSCGVAGFVGQTQRGWEYPSIADCSISGLDITVSGTVTAAGFIAWPGAHTTATNCTTQGKIDASGVTSADCPAGGFFADLGWNCDLGQKGHSIIGCTADVDIIGGGVAPVGGFVGSSSNSNSYSMYAEFTNCAALGDVANENGVAGGFAGDADRGMYINCSAAGTVIGGTSGGFIGEVKDVTPSYDHRYPAGTRDYDANQVKLDGCAATGIVHGSSYAGGLIGYVDEKTSPDVDGSAGKLIVSDCTAASTVVGCYNSADVDGVLNNPASSKIGSIADNASSKVVAVLPEGASLVVGENGAVTLPAGTTLINPDGTTTILTEETSFEDGEVYVPEPDAPLPPAGTDGTDDGTNDDGSDVKPVSKGDGDSSKPLAKTGDSAGLALAGLGAAAVAAAGACAIARRRAE